MKLETFIEAKRIREEIESNENEADKMYCRMLNEGWKMVCQSTSDEGVVDEVWMDNCGAIVPQSYAQEWRENALTAINKLEKQFEDL